MKNVFIKFNKLGEIDRAGWLGVGYEIRGMLLAVTSRIESMVRVSAYNRQDKRRGR
jgi:hypothetical protein